MEKIIIYQSSIPAEEIELVEEHVRSSDMICSLYDDTLKAPYKIREYIEQQVLYGAQIHAMLDRNIVSNLTSVARNSEVRNHSELEAIRLLNFLQIARIDIEPGMSLVEYSDTCINSDPVEELHLLRKLDDIKGHLVHDAALQRTSKIDVNFTSYNGHTVISSPVLQAEEVENWRAHYAYALKIYLLHHDGYKRADLLLKLIDWMWRDYQFSRVAIQFAAVFASEKFSGVLKNVNASSSEKVIKGLRNAAWDMSIIHYWSSNVKKRKEGEPFYLFCTEDKALKTIARHVASQKGVGFCESLSGLITLPRKKMDEIYALYSKCANTQKSGKRAINRHEKKRDEYVESHIQELEEKVKKLLHKSI